MHLLSSQTQPNRDTNHLRDTNELLLNQLNHLPVNRYLVGIMILLLLAWTVESFDIGVVGTVVLSLTKLWHLTANQEGLLGVSSTLGVVLGLIPAGLLADKFGRKRVLMGGIALFSLFTLLAAFAPDLPVLFTLRLIAGLGEGAVFPIPYLMLTEFVHMRKRGTTVGWINGILTAGYVLPTGVGAWALHTYPPSIAWHIPLIIGGLPILLLIPLALWLPESPRYLLKIGQIDAVKRLIQRLTPGNTQGNLVAPQLNETALDKPPMRNHATYSLKQSPYRLRLWISGIGFGGSLIIFYTTLVYVPSIFHADGLTSSLSLVLTASMMILAGVATVFQGYLMDRWGRKIVYGACVSLATIGLFWMGNAHTLSQIVIPGVIVAVFGVGINFLNKVYLAEQFPTALRGHGASTGETIARFGSGVVAIYLIPLMLKQLGPAPFFAAIGTVVLLSMVPILMWGRETAMLNLEESGAAQPTD